MNRLATLLATTTIILGTAAAARAEPVTPARVEALPAADRGAWQAYLAKSAVLAKADQAALDAELAANGMTAARIAPDGGDFKLPAKAGDPYYSTDAAKQLADVILSYQAPSGGWSKHTGYSKGPRQPGTQFSSQYKPGNRPHYLATFDNRSTTEQLHFLANYAAATGDARAKAAFARGLDYVLAAQYPNGGWPQVYPLEGGYHDDITFNDDAMTHVMQLLAAVASDDPAYAFVDADRRTRAADALERGLRCTLKLQVEIDGKKTVWCAQHDALTLAPSSARAFEPATLSGGESARILEFLMSLPSPDAPTVAAIEAGLAWFEKAKVTDVARVQRNGRTTYEVTPGSTEVYWARFYDLKTGKPIFPGRDKVYETYAELAAQGPVGYDYYSTRPGSVIGAQQAKWRKRMTTMPATRQ